LTFDIHAYSQQRLFVSKVNIEGNVKITTSQWDSLNEELIIVIGKNIDSKSYVLLSSENITELLPPGVDLEDCIGKCIVKIGRDIQAHVTVHGNLKRVDDYYRLYITATKTSNGEILEKSSLKFKLFDDAFDKIRDIKILKAKSKFSIDDLDRKIQSKMFDIEKCSESLWKRNMYKNTMSFFVTVHKKGIVLKGEYDLENSERESYCLTNVLNKIHVEPFESDNDVFKKLFIFKINKIWKKHRDYLKSIGAYGSLNNLGLKVVPKSKRHPRNRNNKPTNTFEKRIIDAGLNNRSLSYDSDGDGIFDQYDYCPQVPEDFDGIHDEDGCPDYNYTVEEKKVGSKLNNAKDILGRIRRGKRNLPLKPRKRDIKTAMKRVNVSKCLSRDPSLKGKGTIKVRITIISSGQITKASVHNKPFKDSIAATCIEREIKRLRFSRFKHPVIQFTFPFRT
tara:strand:+ start:1564 stop:2913 length:1350 start_codon:yes stop_codon:yes gene_type:complete